MGLAFVLAVIFAVAGLLFNYLLFLPATFFLMLGFGLYARQKLLAANEPAAPAQHRDPLTSWNPYCRRREGQSKAERGAHLSQLAEDKDGSWGRWQKGQ